MSGAGLRRPEAGEYPPPRHLLRDLGIFTERSAGRVWTGLRAGPAVADGQGRVHAGVLATLVDVAGGSLALSAAAPDWIATQDLSIHSYGLPVRGDLTAHPSVVRRGQSTVIVEAPLRAEAQDVGRAIMSFRVVPARGGAQFNDPDRPDERYDFALPDSGFTSSIAEALAVDADAGGDLYAPLGPYLGNSLGAMQGGAVAILVDLAAARAAEACLGAPATVRDLSLRYLSLVKVGPVRAHAEILHADAGGALVRIEIRDAGANDRFCTLGLARAMRSS